MYIFNSILLWNDLEEKFTVCRQYSTQEPCSCLHFTQASLIVGAEKFYEIDLKTFDIEGICFCITWALELSLGFLKQGSPAIDLLVVNLLSLDEFLYHEK